MYREPTRQLWELITVFDCQFVIFEKNVIVTDGAHKGRDEDSS